MFSCPTTLVNPNYVEPRHELGCRLFVRLPRKVQLTPEGRAFLPEATSVAAAMSRARAVLLDGNTTTAGTLRVGTVLSLSLGVLPPSLTEMRRRHPAVNIELIEYSHRNLLEQGVTDGDCDIAVGPRPSDWHGTLVSMGWEEFVVVLPEDDPADGGQEYRSASPGPTRLGPVHGGPWTDAPGLRGVRPRRIREPEIGLWPTLGEALTSGHNPVIIAQRELPSTWCAGHLRASRSR